MQNHIVKAILLIVLCYALPTFAGLRSVAFYYGPHPPLDILRAFDITVVNPTDQLHPNNYNTSSSELAAYVSVGEVAQTASDRQQIKPTWVIAKNEAWQSLVIDQTQMEWQQYFINQIITPLWDSGYKSFFLDTLDSYQLAQLTPQQKTAQVKALAQLIQAIKTKYPSVKLILNRGFELLPLVHDQVYAVAAESLFAGWDQK